MRVVNSSGVRYPLRALTLTFLSLGGGPLSSLRRETLGSGRRTYQRNVEALLNFPVLHSVDESRDRICLNEILS
jgi:hypothetical protein